MNNKQFLMIALGAGVVGAMSAGPFFVGLRHSLPKGAAILAGLVIIGVASIVAMNHDTFSVGVITELVAGSVMTLAAIAYRAR